MLNDREIQIRIKLRDNFPFYAEKCLRITDKSGNLIPFLMNRAQTYVHEQLEKQRKETGKVRAIILKGRQQGISTYIEARFLHQTTHRKGVRTFILTHAQSATQSLYTMTKRYYYNLPELVRPTISKNNVTELDFRYLDSGYRVATAGSTGVGRGSTINLLHASEVAYWPNGEDHITGVLQAVADVPNTEIIMESTASGPEGLFYKMCMDAHHGNSPYRLVFVPWFWQDEYREEVPDNFELTLEEKTYAEEYDLDSEQMLWRRNKINTFVRGIADFRREYPATVEEAFLAEAENALWLRKDIEVIPKHRFDQLLSEFEDESDTIIGFDPAGTSKESSDESGVIVATLIGDIVYVHHDASGRYRPDAIVSDIRNLYHRYDASRLTIETNFGGDWIPSTFEAEDPNIVIHKVHARKGKKLRAEPVAHAYRQGRVKHVGNLSKLEDEMTTWNPYDSKARSPNRIDALVYAVTDLLDIAVKRETPVLWSAG